MCLQLFGIVLLVVGWPFLCLGLTLFVCWPSVFVFDLFSSVY